MTLCWGRWVSTLPLHKESILGLPSSRSWRFLRWRHILPRLILRWFLHIYGRVRNIEPRQQVSNKSSASPMGWYIAPSHSVWQISGGVYAHWIVTEQETLLLCTETTISRASMTQIISRIICWIWQPSDLIQSPYPQTWRSSFSLLLLWIKNLISDRIKSVHSMRG